MTFERATYNRKKVHQARETVKALTTTCARKNEHFSKAIEIKNACDTCLDLTGCVLFEYEYTPVQDYYKAAFNYKNYTCKELNFMARRAVDYLKNELNGILAMMASGEVNVEDDENFVC